MKLDMTHNQKIIQFTLIYNKQKKKLFNYVQKMVNNKMIAEDIVQNVFVKLFENLESIRNRDGVVFWIFRTARNEIYSHYRTKKSHVDKYNVLDPEEIEVVNNVNIAEEIEKEELKEIILKVIDKFPEDQKEPYLLKEFGELSYKEISKLLNIEESLVKSRLYNMRQRLVKEISKIYN